MKVRMVCRKRKDGTVEHVYKCTCKENYWESEAGKKDKNYPKYLEWKGES